LKNETVEFLALELKQFTAAQRRGILPKFYLARIFNSTNS